MDLDELAVRVLEARLRRLEEYAGRYVHVCTDDSCYEGCLAEVDLEALMIRLWNPFKESIVIIAAADITDVEVHGVCRSDGA